MRTFKLLLLVCALFSTKLFAQTIEMGIPNKGSEFPDLISDDGGDFYTTSYIKTALYMSLVDYKLTRFENMTKVAEEKIKRDIPTGGKGEIFGTTCLNGKPIVILSNTEKTTTSIYYQVYDEQCKPVSEPALIAEFEVEEKKRQRGFFSYMISQNKEFILFEYMKKGKKSEEDRLVYKVLNSDFGLVQEGEYETSANVSSSMLTNKGEYLIALAVYQQNEKGKETDKIETYRIKHFKDGKETELNIDTQGKAQFSFNMSVTNDNQLILLGAFSEGSGRGYTYININLDTEKEVKRVYCTPNTGMKIEYIRDYFLDADGGLVVLGEEYSEKTVTTTSQTSSGVSTRTSTTYYYNDACAFKIMNDGEPEWLVKIPKHQYSVNDGGMASSLAGYTSGGKYYLFFNDNLKNYGPDGNFLNPEKVETCFYKNKKCGFIKVDIDLKSGESNRQIMLRPDVQPLFSIPNYFVKSEDKNEMLIYFMNRKTEQFGLMKF